MDTSQTNATTGHPYRRTRLIISVVMFAAICGCASSRQGPLVTRRIQDPPQLSPFARPLVQPGETAVPYGASRPTLTAPQPSPVELGTPSDQYGPLTTIPPRHDESVPELLPPPNEDQSLSGPELGGSTYGDLSAPKPTPPSEHEHSHSADRDKLVVKVDAPETTSPGEEIAFQVTVRNADVSTVEDVMVLCSLPEGIAFPGASQRAFQQQLGPLKAGEERVLDLELRCERTGRHCVEFRVSAAGIDDITEPACVTAREKSVQLELSGPSNRTTGNQAEYVITMTNHTGQELPDVHVVLEHDGVLKPREASTGVLKKPGRLEWDLGLVRRDERIQIQVEFACDFATEQTLLTARVHGRSLEPREVTSTLEVLPRREIEIEVADEDDPVAIGERVVYQIRVTNHGLQPASNLILELEPNGLQPLGVSVDGIDALASADFDSQSGLLRLPLPTALLADESQTITLATTAARSGDVGLRATISNRHGEQATMAESTVVNSLPSSIAVGSR